MKCLSFLSVLVLVIASVSQSQNSAGNETGDAPNAEIWSFYLGGDELALHAILHQNAALGWQLTGLKTDAGGSAFAAYKRPAAKVKVDKSGKPDKVFRKLEIGNNVADIEEKLQEYQKEKWNLLFQYTNASSGNVYGLFQRPRVKDELPDAFRGVWVLASLNQYGNPAVPDPVHDLLQIDRGLFTLRTKEQTQEGTTKIVGKISDSVLEVDFLVELVAIPSQTPGITNPYFTVRARIMLDDQNRLTIWSGGVTSDRPKAKSPSETVPAIATYKKK